jgi:hypothetical protein
MNKDHRIGFIGHRIGLVRSHATAGAKSSKVRGVFAKCEDVVSTPGSADGGGAILHLARVLANCECVGAVELRPLSKLVQAAFTGLLVLLSVHPEIVLWEATG